MGREKCMLALVILSTMLEPGLANRAPRCVMVGLHSEDGSSWDCLNEYMWILLTVIHIIKLMLLFLNLNCFKLKMERFVVEGGSGGGEVVVRMREGVQGRRGTRVLR